MLQKMLFHLNRSVKLCWNFSVLIGLLYFLEKISFGGLRTIIHRKRMSVNKTWINKKFKDKIMDEQFNNNCDYDYEDTHIIWMYWGQGYENAPDLIKMCIDNAKLVCSCQIIIIDNDNFEEYVRIPDVIIRKFKKGLMNYTNFSDVLRSYLLFQRGGMWIDPTVYISRFDDSIWKYDFWTIKRIRDDSIGSISYYRWNTAIMRGNRKLFQYICVLWEKYWEDNNYMLDYFLIDYFLDFILETIPSTATLLEEIPYSNDREFDLNTVINDNYDDHYFSDLVSECDFHKLQRRNDFAISTQGGEMTFFGYISRKGD